MNIQIITPINHGREILIADFCKSIIDGMMHLIREGIDVEFDTCCGLRIDSQRNRAVYEFLQSSYEILIFIDDDMAFWPEDLSNIIWRVIETHGIALFPYTAKHWPFHFYFKQAGMADSDWPIMLDTNAGWTEVCEAGTGFMAIHRDVLENMEPPWFLLRADKYGTLCVTEDVYFTSRASYQGFMVEVDQRHYVKHICQTTFPEIFEHPYIRTRFTQDIEEYGGIGNVRQFKLAERSEFTGVRFPRTVATDNFYDGVDNCAHAEQHLVTLADGKVLCKCCGEVFN